MLAAAIPPTNRNCPSSFFLKREQKVGETSSRGLWATEGWSTRNSTKNHFLSPVDVLATVFYDSLEGWWYLYYFSNISQAPPLLPEHLVGLGFFRDTGARGSLRSPGSCIPRILSALSAIPEPS